MHFERLKTKRESSAKQLPDLPKKRAMTTNQAMTTAAKMATAERNAIMDHNFYLSPVLDSARGSEQKSRQQEIQKMKPQEEQASALPKTFKVPMDFVGRRVLIKPKFNISNAAAGTANEHRRP